MRCCLESNCLKTVISKIKQNPAKTGLYLVIMAIFIAVMTSQKLPLETRAIVGYSMAGVHGVLLLVSGFYNKSNRSHQSKNALIAKKNRADQQMRDLMSPHANHRIANAQLENNQITFSEADLTHAVMQGIIQDQQCIFYVVKCHRVSDGEVFVLTFFQREFLKNHDDGEFYIQGDYPEDLFKEEFNSFTEPNGCTTRFARLNKLLLGQLNHFKLGER